MRRDGSLFHPPALRLHRGHPLRLRSLDRPLREGDRLVIENMAHYRIVKNAMLNGVHLPSIYLYRGAGPGLECVRRFDYEEYRRRRG